MSVQDEIAAVNGPFCAGIASGDAENMREFYSDDPWFLVPGAEAIKGIDAVLGAVQGLIDSGITRLELTTAEIDDLGNTAVEVGQYVLYAGDVVADSGKFMVVWKKNDGNWRIHRDMINTSVAA
ncbi:MAG: nuclear transport factor 2 family protein [Kordiimonadaceae bacterium]|jgi:uncharacterized protein (TIGR02246 family)|nr:nuclear transport factor 2 family protein [Kordiimonadaceae bacterium]MBT6036886.1 nuclear transport factor 2 family protein [Kordiimonadaceae bacterium]MBT6328190.1 nuclear transport factor 2 family protein [Kordiimonadaceae bacterium]MBT7582533.1 nuclear transport factor 2 family protein [Kordiimonadaceae bacterium]